MKDVADTLIGKMPESNEQVDGPEFNSGPATESLIDAAGTNFDPALHQKSKDGGPKYTKAGNFKKKAGKKSQIADVTPPDQDAAYKACGSSTAEMIFIAGQGLGGPEWNPRPEERIYMTEAWTQYFQAKGIEDLPPGVIVATALISYGAPRFTMPETQSRTKKVIGWLKNRIARMRGIVPPISTKKSVNPLETEQDRMNA